MRIQGIKRINKISYRQPSLEEVDSIKAYVARELLLNSFNEVQKVVEVKIEGWDHDPEVEIFSCDYHVINNKEMEVLIEMLYHYRSLFRHEDWEKIKTILNEQ